MRLLCTSHGLWWTLKRAFLQFSSHHSSENGVFVELTSGYSVNCFFELLQLHSYQTSLFNDLFGQLVRLRVEPCFSRFAREFSQLQKNRSYSSLLHVSPSLGFKFITNLSSTSSQVCLLCSSVSMMVFVHLCFPRSLHGTAIFIMPSNFWQVNFGFN